jgi:uncharacterized membrane protein YkoI
MSQKSLLALAGTLTAFVLVLVGGVAGRVSSAQAAAPAAIPSPAVAELWNQREAAYRSLIDQANQRLLDANAQAAAAAEAKASAADSNPAGLAANITPEQAAVLALVASRGGSLTAQPELVNFEGTVAYEVKLTSGPIYIDAATGRVLYNSAARQVIIVSSGSHSENESGDD